MVDHRALEIEADRILDVADRAGVVLGLVGSVAILGRCPNHALLASGDHVYRDIDFAARKQEVRDIHELLARLGYVEDREVFVVSEGARAIFGSAYKGVHVDVFYEKLDFCPPYICKTGFRSTRPHFRWQSCSWPTAQGVFQEVLNDEILSIGVRCGVGMFCQIALLRN